MIYIVIVTNCVSKIPRCELFFIIEADWESDVQSFYKLLFTYLQIGTTQNADILDTVVVEVNTLRECNAQYLAALLKLNLILKILLEEDLNIGNDQSNAEVRKKSVQEFVSSQLTQQKVLGVRVRFTVRVTVRVKTRIGVRLPTVYFRSCKLS
jgi:hypothetical protein